MTVFQSNDHLTSLFQAQPGAPSIQIGEVLGEGMYSKAYLARAEHPAGNDEENNLRTLRLFKSSGPAERWDIKQRNILHEQSVLNKFEEAGVSQRLFKQQGVHLRHVLDMTPQQDGVLQFWKDNPMRYGGFEFVAYQTCSFIPGAQLSDIREERQNPKFLDDIGRHLGRVIAEFHDATREVAGLPRYESEEDMKGGYHAYRIVHNAVKLAAERAMEYPSRAFLIPIARDICESVKPVLMKALTTDPAKLVVSHGDAVPGNFIFQKDLNAGWSLKGVLDFDKTCLVTEEARLYDLIASCGIPGMYPIAAEAYVQRMSELTGNPVKINLQLAPQCAAALHIVRASSPPQAYGVAAKRLTNEEIFARDILGVYTALQALQGDPKYASHIETLRPRVEKFRWQYPGIDLAVT